MNKGSALFFVFLFLSCSLNAQASPAEDLILKGNELVQKKDFAGAIKEYEKAVKLDPKNSKAHLLLGLTYANKGDFEKALKYSRNSIAIAPSYAAYQNLGLIYANKGEYVNAVDAYEEALKVSPQSATAWYQLGLLHSGNGHFKEGVEAYKKSIEFNPRLSNAYLGLGSAYYWSGDKTLAGEQVQKLRGINRNEQASQLEEWIKNKEEKKKEVSVPSPSPTPIASDSPADTSGGAPQGIP